VKFRDPDESSIDSSNLSGSANLRLQCGTTPSALGQHTIWMDPQGSPVAAIASFLHLIKSSKAARASTGVFYSSARYLGLNGKQAETANLRFPSENALGRNRGNLGNSPPSGVKHVL
jgi:hypothetical protein